MLKPVALFINGVFETVLEEILQIQAVLPEQIMFLHQSLTEVGHTIQCGAVAEVSDGKPLSTGRTTAGGWSYVHSEVLS